MKKIIFIIILVLAFNTKSFAFDNPNIILDKNIYNLKLLNNLQNNSYNRNYYSIPNINL